MTHILAFSGSARKGSYNTAVINAFVKELPASVTAEVVDFSDIPLYNQDMEAAFPAEVTALKDKIKAADGIVLSTPEYNRSIPGYFKNMIDWTSRPYGDSAWKGKKVLIMGASGGNIAAALAQYDLKKVMLYLDAHVLGQPEVYIGGAGAKFATDAGGWNVTGGLTDEDTRTHLKSAGEALVKALGA